MSILDKPVTRGKLWGASYTWKEAIDGTVDIANSGMGCFIVTDEGVWMEGDGSRNASYRTKLPKGAEVYALNAIATAGFAQSQYDRTCYVSPRYGPQMEIKNPDDAEFLKEKGFQVGHRDPGRNKIFIGRYMVAQRLEGTEQYPTEVSGDAWCVVGDDIDQLIEETRLCFDIDAPVPEVDNETPSM